jgi:hypothetical protein
MYCGRHTYAPCQCHSKQGIYYQFIISKWRNTKFLGLADERYLLGWMHASGPNPGHRAIN